MKNPTATMDLESIAEVHPSIKSADIFPKMRSLNDEDLIRYWRTYSTST